MTLNQVIQRLEKLAISHKQINHFFFGDLVEWLANGDLKYPCCFVEINNSTISKTDHQTKYNLSVWFLDLVNVDTAARANEVDVMSDLTSICEDYTAMLNFVDYQDDWTINTDYALQYFREKFEDMTIATKVDITVGVDYTANRCQVPASGIIFEPASPDSPSLQIKDGIVYNYLYHASGNEGVSLTLGTLVGKLVLMLFKGDKILQPVANTPDVDQYAFNSTTGLFTFGVNFEQDQILQFIYR
jgi:hypothetical protein